MKFKKIEVLKLKRRYQARLKPSFLRLFTAILFITILTSVNLGSYSVSKPEKVLSSRTISLSTRQPNSWVNTVFADNILLNIAYMRGLVQKEKSVDWSIVRQPFTASVTIEPGKVFSFHDDALPEYKDQITATTKAHFNSSEGFRSDGYLVGDGVCHLASLLYWAARDAQLDVKVPTNHNFAVIPEIPKEYGVAIYYMPGSHSANASENLYIKNNRNVPVEFKLVYDGKNLTAQVIQTNHPKLAYK